VMGACGLVLTRGLRRGIERVSRLIVPALYVILFILIARSLTLPGAGEGLRWFLGAFRFAALTPPVMAAALGMAFFSLSLGGTFMVIYGSYMGEDVPIPRNALYTGVGALLAGLLAGLAIFPAVFALGMSPDSGPGLIFDTLPATFARMPLGGLFGFLFFAGLFGAAFLSDVAAFEVLVGGLVDNTRLRRPRAVAVVLGLVFLLALPPMLNNRIFIPWDLAFGSGLQALGGLLAVVTAGWCLSRAALLSQLSGERPRLLIRILIWWLRIAVPAAIILVGGRWLFSVL